ncbi:histone deacetylase [bacterium]|nr:histone deacetylase [bacterium]
MLKIANDVIYNLPLKKKHRFPMLKYKLLPELLIKEGTCTNDNFFIPSDISDEDILLTHKKFYYDKLLDFKLNKKELRAIGFPMSQLLIDREKKIIQGTIESALYSLDNNVSLNIAGGTHHAFSDRAEAFCILNDQSIAANYLIDRNLCKKILILDLDVHQGNGTAEIFRNKANVFTASFHGENNYPFRKEKSDFDYGFQNNVSDIEYLKVIKYEVPKLIEDFEPNFIFYLSGVDIIDDDKLGKLSVSLIGCKERDRFVLDYCNQNKIPIQISMGGGYSQDINTIVEAHANTFRLAQEIFF